MKKLKVNQNSNVAEVFKEFCKERHAEDKGRNYNKLQEIYANTELFDLTFCPSKNDYKTNDYSLSNNDLIFSSDFLIDLCLPFGSIFSKVNTSENNELTSFIFIREYLPTVITGTVYFYYKIGVKINAPFTLYTDSGKLIIDITGFQSMIKTFEKVYPNNPIYREAINKALITDIQYTLDCLTNLPKHSVASDKPTKAEYYPRRNADTIKVIRPIYYVMNKSEEKKPNQLKLIKPIGHLEFSHAFKVRCHYRRINENSLGLNRNGERIVKGYTFVKEYIKGEGEFVKKIRILK